MINEFIILGAADNMRFLYECLRKTLKKDINGSRENEETFIQGIKVLFMKSKEPWKHWIKKHEHNRQWQRLLNRVLLSLSEDALIIYADTIDINIDIANGQEIYRTINEISAEKMQGIQNQISEPLCLRWKSYLEELRRAKTYHDSVKKMAYVGLILPAIRYYECRTQSDWERIIISNIDILLKHMTQWYKSYTQFKSIFWIDYIQIIYLMNIGDECGYTQENEVQKKVQELELFIERNKYLI